MCVQVGARSLNFVPTVFNVHPYAVFPIRMGGLSIPSSNDT